MALLFTLVLVVVVQVSALTHIESPASLAKRDIRTTILAKNVGRQSVLSPISGPLRLLKQGSSSCHGLEGTIVLIEIDYTMKNLQATSLVGEKCGAVAVLYLMYQEFPRSRLGAMYFIRDEDCCRESPDAISIPVVTASFRDFSETLDTLSRNSSIDIIVNISSNDENKWVTDLAESKGFQVWFFVLLPVANGLLALASLAVLHRQRSTLATYLRTKRSQFPSQVVTPITPIQLICVLEFVSCAVRCVYCACGMFLMNDFFSWQAHGFLLTATIPLEICVIAILVLTMRRVSVSSKLGHQDSKMKVVIGCVCLVDITSELLVSFMRSLRKETVIAITLSGFLAIIFVGVSVGSVVYYGWRFFKVTKVNSKGFFGRSHLATWLLIGTIPQVVAVAVLGTIALFPNWFYRSHNCGLIFGLHYTGLTLSTLCHLIAFFPTVATRAAVHVDDSLSLNSQRQRPTHLATTHPALNPATAAFFAPASPVCCGDPLNVKVDDVCSPTTPIEKYDFVEEEYALASECVL